MAKLKRREDGRYSKEVYLERKADGKYRRVTVYGKTQKEVNEKAAEIKSRYERGLFIDDPEMTFEKMGELWITTYKPDISFNHQKTYQSILKNHLYPIIGNIKLKDLRQIHLQSIITQMNEKGYATATMKNVRMTANQVMNTAIDNKLLLQNPFLKVTVPKKKKTERRALTEQEICLLTENCFGHRMCIPALIMLYCGLRRGEIIALHYDKDFDWNRKVIHVQRAAEIRNNHAVEKDPKTEAGNREVPIPDILMEILRLVPNKHGFVCRDADNSDKMLSDTGWKRGWDSYIYYLNKCAGGKDAYRGHGVQWVIDSHITAHMLRHTYATLLFDAGVDVKTAQKFLGHSTLQVTLEIYTHLSKFKEDHSVKALNQHLSKVGIQQQAKLKIV